MVLLCEMYHARQSPRPVLIKSLQKPSFIGQISQYFPAREVVRDWSVLTKLSLCMGLVPCEWHRMASMTGPDCAVIMCNLINIHITANYAN